ncbi:MULTISPECIES: glycerophosphodiester phosphodiesterase [Bacillaceae]|uniref:glycerophosphodiester phosphodiesterase n=1 Tax=Shouchella oshimensis TaxID=290588 RepID=UPI0006EBF7AB|nr:MULTISPECIES: glycerophosphodiester phosphodiesterase family protein [Bacillaceae]
MSGINDQVGPRLYQTLEDITGLHKESKEARERSQKAVNTANDSKWQSEMTKEQLKKATETGTPIEEVGAAKVNTVTGETYDWYPDRLDGDYRAVTGQLAQAGEEINRAKTDRRGANYSTLGERLNDQQTVLPLHGRGMFHLIAHRGCTIGTPENTIFSLSRLRNFVKGVEIDVQLTSDGVPVLMHDFSVNRTTTGSGMVADMTYNQIKLLDAGIKTNPNAAKVHVPSLEAYLKACRTFNIRMVLIDPKGTMNERYNKAVQQAIFKANMQDRVVVLCRSISDMDQFRQVEKQMNVGFLGTDSTNIEERLNCLKRNKGVLSFISPGQLNNNIETVKILQANDILAGGSIENAPQTVENHIISNGLSMVLSDAVNSLSHLVEVRSYG